MNGVRGTSGVSASVLSRAGLVVAIALLGALLVSPAWADDMMMASGVLEAVGIAFFGWIAATLFVEAWILALVLDVGYGRALGYSFAANSVSALLGLLWMAVFHEPGWKVALLDREWGRVSALMLRSFLVTVAEEGMVVSLLVGGAGRARRVFAAVALANVASYALIVFLYAFIPRPL